MARMTIRDIARLAGVSVTTVSRALNNAPEINSQTRERVLQVCREQGYRSNLLARSLVSSRTRVLGVILPELSGPFHASIVLHLERYAQEQDYQIMLCCGRVGGSETAALFDFLVSHRVDGILLVSASSAAPDLLRRHARGTPSVLLGDVSPTATLQRINAVSTDNYVGGAMAAGYLSRLGHRRVLYLGPRRDSVTHVLRHQGFLTIARERGMEVETVFNPGAVSSAPGVFASFFGPDPVNLLGVGLFLPFTGPVCNLVWLFAGASLQSLFTSHRRAVDTTMAAALVLCAFSLVWPFFTEGPASLVSG